MKKPFALLLIPALAGCLTSVTVPAISHWPIDYSGPVIAATDAKYGVARLLQVAVRAPYNASGITVLRGNGTVEPDPFNEYAAQPPQLVKVAACDALAASGLFANVVDASSTATSDVSVEVVVTRLALDCRNEGSRRAVANVMVLLLKNREIVKSVKGAGEVDAADGNYGAAISGAVSSALMSAFGQLR